MHDVIVKTLLMAGLAIVVSMFIAVVIKVIVVTLNAFEKRHAAASKPTTEPVTVAPAFDVLADHVAAISAAVYAMLGSHRIVHIEEHRRPGWVVEGRLAHHTSHAVPHHPKH